MALILFAAAAPGALPGGDSSQPSVAAIGGGVVWVRDGKRFHLFATRDGAYLRLLDPGFFVEEVRFDASRSEFWGTGWDAEPLVWSWSSGGGFERRGVPARQVYASYQAENGQRVIAATLSTAGSAEEVHASFVALGVWKEGKIRFVRAAPPPSRGIEWAAVSGQDALFGYLVDTSRPRAVLPPEDLGSETTVWFARLPHTDRWLMADEGTLRVRITGGADTDWKEVGEIPAPPAGLQFRLIGLLTDPFRSGCVYATVEVSGGRDRSVWIWSSQDAGRHWTRLATRSSPAASVRFFDEDGLWLEAHPREGTTIGLDLVRPDGTAGRTLRLEVPRFLGVLGRIGCTSVAVD